ncbi:uncharacterized protein LOC113146713 [Cyclospora cayetanensis]|uniref:Uncharacterized protein LOC113146713 n=1 Tax=Cyclospora cayetanensis TaxID=88456 RepID=A0A6P6RS91_9EIME|nr:uncharacterized protein LOC113146713 [Cyclospora cayetanensis]
MFLDFVDSSSLLLLPPRKAAEALVAQHRERLSLAKQHKQRGLATCPPPAHKRLRGPRRATTGCTTRLVPQSGGPSAAAPCGNEGTLATLERSLAARNTLHRLRHQVLELPKPNRHGVGLIYGARMSSDDGHDYRQAAAAKSSFAAAAAAIAAAAASAAALLEAKEGACGVLLALSASHLLAAAAATAAAACFCASFRSSYKANSNEEVKPHPSICGTAKVPIHSSVS